MSSIKPKKGKCCDCSEPQADVYLTAGRCQYHYTKHRHQVNADKRKARGIDVSAFQDKKDLDNWFYFQISNMPERCENCNEKLYDFAPWALRSFIAHIVPKRNVKSVKLHVMNRMFLCGICHTNYDNWGADKVTQMPCYALAVERFMMFKADIVADELKFVPIYLIEAAA